MKNTCLAFVMAMLVSCTPAPKEKTASVETVPTWDEFGRTIQISVSKVRFPDSERYVFFASTSANQRTSSLLKIPWTFRTLEAAAQFAKARPRKVTITIGDRPMLIDDAKILIDMSASERKLLEFQEP